ncbi:MAG TPA: glycosyltransferase [Candidatus Saccharimonas sp.]|nr:glycosyltransferase [Candidatus Saccharimonas sp.]
MSRPIVTTSWDDGHKLDVRLAELLRRYNIPATFYISPRDREFTREDLLTDAQIKTLAKDFEIGAHTMTHPRLTEVSDDQARQEMFDSKTYLEKLLGKPVTTFCYPGGNYFKRHVAMAAELGFAYARTVKRHFYRINGAPQESHTTVNAYNHYQDLWKIFKFAGYNPFKVPYYFQWQNLAKAMFDKARREGGTFHLWGHSWEIDQHGDWQKLEEVLRYISGHADVQYAVNGELAGLNKPRLLIAAPYYKPLVGGVERYAEYMARGALSAGYDVSVVTSADVKTHQVSDEDGIRVHRLPTQFKIMNTPVNVAWYWQIKKIIHAEDPGIVNAHAPVPGLPDIAIFAARGRKRIVTYHSGTMKKRAFIADELIGLYEKLLLPRMLRAADRIVCSSTFVRDGFLQKYAAKSTVITPGVDLQAFPKRTKAPNTRRILFVGNFRSGIKGLEFLQRAVAMIPGVELHVVGEGEPVPDDHTVYYGALRGADLLDEFHKADILVLPSVCATESFGMVLVEAMACGVPVIGSNVGGIPTVITDGETGLLVTPADAEALAIAIVDLLDNPQKAAKLATNAYQKVTQIFTWQHSTALFLELLQNSSRPTIVHVAGYYPPHLGGMENVAKALATGLAAEHYNVQVLTSNIPRAAAELTTNNLGVHRLKAFEFAHTPITPGFSLALWRTPKHSIVHLHLAQAYFPERVWLTCKLRRVPYVVHFHLDLQPSGPLGAIFMAYKKTVLRLVIRGATKVAVFSPEQQAFVRQTYGRKHDDIAIIPNGVGEDYFMPARTYKTRANQVLFVGRLAAQKRVDRLIGAMAKLPNTHLTIVGDGDQRAALQKQANGAKNITFVGYKNPIQTREFYKTADVLVVPSDREGMSLVTLEAMASALPIVASDAPGLTELLRNVGVLVQKPGPETFAVALKKILNDPKELTSLSAKSLAAAKHYAWPKVVDQFVALYKGIKA